MAGELWCRNGQDVWDNKNIFTHRTLTHLEIRNIMLSRAFKQIRRLEFPKELKLSTNLTALVLDGIHLAALPAVFRLPKMLETLELIFMEPKGESNPWSVATDPPFNPSGADRNIVADALGPVQHTLRSLLFMHDNLPAFPWGQHFSRLQTLVVSSENLFPPGPKHWTGLELFDLIPRGLVNLKIENCDFKLELNGDIDESVEIPRVDYNKVIFINRSLQRLMTCLRADDGHGLKDLTISIPWAAHSGVETIQFGELPAIHKSFPSLEKIQDRFSRLIEALWKRRGTKVRIMTRGHFENDVGKFMHTPPCS